MDFVISDKKSLKRSVVITIIVSCLVSLLCFVSLGVAYAGFVIVLTFLYLGYLCYYVEAEWEFTEEYFKVSSLFGRKKVYSWEDLHVSYLKLDNMLSIMRKDDYMLLALDTKEDIDKVLGYLVLHDIEIEG